MSDFTFNPLQMALKPFYEQAKAEDELFAKEVQEKESRTEKPRSFGECCDYIMGEAYDYAINHKTRIEGGQQFGLSGCDEKQIIAMIKHYYDEDDIKIRKVGANVKPVVKTTATPATKPSKPKKEERPKEKIAPGLTPMVRPKDEKEAKRESKKQAKAVEVMDMFAGMWDDEEETDTAEVVTEVEDDMPM